MLCSESPVELGVLIEVVLDGLITFAGARVQPFESMMLTTPRVFDRALFFQSTRRYRDRRTCAPEHIREEFMR